MNVKRWFKNANEKVIHGEEKQYIDKDGDLIPVVSKIKTPLRRFIDKFEKPRLLALFRQKDVGCLDSSSKLVTDGIRLMNASMEALETSD